MGKIKVTDLARMMNIPDQDLLFKLRAIGVRVDEDDPRIDSDIIQAILEGKKLPSPREVILRDGETQEAAPPRRRPAGRRLPPTMRPSRRRPAIQKVEPRIRTIPVTERPAAPETKPAVAAPVPDRKVAETATSAQRAPRPSEKRDRPPRRPRPEIKPEDLRDLRGTVEEVEEEAADREGGVSHRGRRRAERKRREKEAGGKVLSFKHEAPSEAVTLTEGMTVREFAEKLGVKAKDLIKILFDRGLMATINHVLDVELAAQIAEDLGVETLHVSFEEEVQLEQEKQLDEDAGGEPRSPVVTIMGHVDHGKTTLLDTLRSSKVVDSEFGGITQHIGAYEVETNGRKIVFLDTPGHEAFTLMRARGAQVTDIVILVVAADDGVMPQTLEALDHAKAAEVPILIAINKIDKDNADPQRVKKELADRGLMVEEYGGDTVAVPISALQGEGIPDLLEMIGLTSDLLELKANPELPAQGVVIEARKEPGRGILATVLVQNGTLRDTDVFVTGATWGRVRSMTDDQGERLEEAGPATPIEVSGFNELPEAGDLFQVVEDESKARGIASFRQEEQRRQQLGQAAPGKVSLESLFDQIQQGEVKELPVVLKADVQGSVEVLTDTLGKLSTDQVKVQIIHSGVGAITTNDVLLASASGAVVVGFNVRPERNATELADRNQVDIRLHTVIYELADEMRKAMTGLLEPTFREVATGRAEVRETFKVPKFGNVAGCHVIEGVIPRSASVRLLRDNVVVHEGKIAQLKRFKDDASEVRSGFDCGIRLEKYQDYKPGDTIEAYIQEEVAPTL